MSTKNMDWCCVWQHTFGLKVFKFIYCCKLVNSPHKEKCFRGRPWPFGVPQNIFFYEMS